MDFAVTREHGAWHPQGYAPAQRTSRDTSAHRLARAAIWLAAGGLLRELREARGWSQQELATRARVSLGIVTQYELGEKRDPSLEAWWRLTAALQRDLAQFMEEVEARVHLYLWSGAMTPPGFPPSTATPNLATALWLGSQDGMHELRHELRELTGQVRAWSRARNGQREGGGR